VLSRTSASNSSRSTLITPDGVIRRPAAWTTTSMPAERCDRLGEQLHVQIVGDVGTDGHGVALSARTAWTVDSAALVVQVIDDDLVVSGRQQANGRPANAAGPSGDDCHATRRRSVERGNHDTSLGSIMPSRTGVGNWSPPARRSANARSAPTASSPRRRSTSSGWPETDAPTPRLPRNYSSAPTPSNGTFARSSPNWASPPAGTSTTPCPGRKYRGLIADLGSPLGPRALLPVCQPGFSTGSTHLAEARSSKQYQL